MKLDIKILLILIMPTMGMAQRTQPDTLKGSFIIAKTDSEKYSDLRKLALHYLERDRQVSLNYLEQAALIAKRNDRLVDEAYMTAFKGYIQEELTKYPESFASLQRALQLADDQGNENKSWNVEKYKSLHFNRLGTLAQVHQKLGVLMAATNNVEQEIIEYKKAKLLCEESGSFELLGIVNENLGYAYLKTNKPNLALMSYNEAERNFKQQGFLSYIGQVYKGLGEIYLKKGNSALALQYFHKAGTAAKQYNNLAGAVSYYLDLTGFFLQQRQPDSSLFYANETLKILHSLGSKDLGPAYENLYKSYQLKKNTDSAYKYQGLALQFKDSSYNTTIKNLADFQKLSFGQQLRAKELEKEKVSIQTKIRTYVLLATIVGCLLLAIIFYRNSWQRQKANAILNNQKEEIESTLLRLKTTQAQLIQAEKMASLGELTAGIAHEIQNPLNFVNNFSEVSVELVDEMQFELKSGDKEEAIAISEDIKQNLEKIRHHGKRADAIVKGMLEHSRAGSGNKEPTDINALADEYLRLSYHGLRAKDKSFNSELVTHLEPDLPKVNVVPQDIGRVLLNLFNNAFYAVSQKSKAAGADYKPEVSVTISSENNRVIIKVKDNGNGIPDAIKDKIMQPFFTTKPTGEGTGLGLSLSYDIVVKGHGGSIAVDSKEGEGSEFIIQFPVTGNI
jgi:two-component system NtrC family sensor kinase